MNNNSSVNSDSSEIEDSLEDRSYGVYWLLLLISLALLCLIPSQVSWVDTTRGWYTQPMIGSVLGLSVLAIFSLVRIIQSFKDSSSAPVGRRENIVNRFFEGLEGYRTALVSSLLFYLYLQTLPVLGFMLSTTIFTLTLLWLSRLLDITWFIADLATVALLILIFRVALHIWLPDTWLYSLLPDNLADFANQYL